MNRSTGLFLSTFAVVLLLAFSTAAHADEAAAREMYARARLMAMNGQHEAAVAACDEIIKQDGKFAMAFQLRGEEQFKRGKFHESVLDFEKYLELVPDGVNRHWQLGISYYYDGKFAAGAKQFEAYQNVDDNDVENVVWRFLCQARADSPEKAKANLYKVKHDRRVPMMEIYQMFRGDLAPADVLKAAEAGDPPADELKQRRFYAHLYMGLYYEALGQADLARDHITIAHEKYPIGHYMADAAHVHAELSKNRNSPRKLGGKGRGVPVHFRNFRSDFPVS